MRPSLARLMRILPKSTITPTSKAAFIPEPLTPRDEAHSRITLVDTLLKRKADVQAKEKSSKISNGKGWPVNLRIERPIVRKVLKDVDEKTRERLKEIIRET